MRYIDNLIIGGGLAGSATAITLARSGKKVLLVEKETVMHDKVCGEFISIEAQHYLADLGIDLKALGAAAIQYLRLIKGSKIATISLPFEGLSLSRRILDESLLKQAQQSGADVERGKTVKKLYKKNSDWCIEFKNHEMIIAKSVFIASGKHDIIGYPRTTNQKNNLIGFKMYFQLAKIQSAEISNYIELILFDGGYAGLELVENGTMNLCLVISKDRFAALGKSWPKLLAALKKETPLLDQRLAGAQALWHKPLAIYAIPYGYVYHSQDWSEKELYRIGDQMAVIPSFCGDGMAIALHTAAMAASYHISANTVINYHTSSQLLRKQIKIAMLISSIIRYQTGQRLVVAACRILPSLVSKMIAATRVKISLRS